MGKETISERHRQRSKGLITPLGGIIDLRLFLTFEPFPTSETKKGLKAEEMRRTYQTQHGNGMLNTPQSESGNDVN